MLPIIVLAPLATAGLVFNAMFACFLVGESFTFGDLVGTVACTIGSALVSIFGYVRQDDLPLQSQLRLLARPKFVQFIVGEGLVMLSLYAYAVLNERRVSRNVADSAGPKLRAGLIFAILSGISCSQTFLLGKCWYVRHSIDLDSHVCPLTSFEHHFMLIQYGVTQSHTPG